MAWGFRILEGNHDAADLARGSYPKHPGTHIRAIRSRWRDWADRGATWTWCGIRFGALGGAFSVDAASRVAGVNWWPGETTSDEDVALLAEQGGLDVMVTHDAPYGVTVPLRRSLPPELAGPSDDNRIKVANGLKACRPKLLVHGHLHVAYAGLFDHGDGTRTRIEGLSSNLEGNLGARGILELPSLAFTRPDRVR